MKTFIVGQEGTKVEIYSFIKTLTLNWISD